MVEVGDRKLSPSAVDDYIYEEANTLRQGMTGPAAEMEPYKPRLPEFVKLMDSAIQDISIDVDTVVAKKSDDTSFAKGVYRLPEIGEVSDVAVNLIRAVAYVPIDEVTPENSYDKAGNEPNDLDLVSVEAKFDVERLYESFGASFFEDVEEAYADPCLAKPIFAAVQLQSYADPCLAKPIFAAVQLQRQQLTDDGRWGDWQVVPRPRIDHNREVFKIGEKIEDLPAGGLKVQMLQFGYKQTQIDLLQPQPYQFASAREEWFPPSLHGEFADFQKKERAEELRKQKEEEKEARERDRDQRSGRRSGTEVGGYGGAAGGQSRSRGTSQYGGGSAGTTNSRNRSSRGRDSSSTARSGTGLQTDTGRSRGRGRGSSRRSGGGDTADQMYDPGMDGIGLPGTTQRGPRRPTINDVYIKYDEVALTRLTEFAKIREPLMFWAHDDTVEPENTYRYRIRLGVFNPVAGTNQLDERDKALADQAVLWSGFSDTTEPVEIMGTMYFFANNVREADKAVTVQVSKLTLGRWYSHDFPVKQGELMGESLEYEPEEPDRRSSLRAGGLRDPAAAVMGGIGPGMSRTVGPGVSRMSTLGGSSDQSNIPEYIDYATGAVMVDAVPVTRQYHAHARRKDELAQGVADRIQHGWKTRQRPPGAFQVLWPGRNHASRRPIRRNGRLRGHDVRRRIRGHGHVLGVPGP